MKKSYTFHLEKLVVMFFEFPGGEFFWNSKMKILYFIFLSEFQLRVGASAIVPRKLSLNCVLQRCDMQTGDTGIFFLVVFFPRATKFRGDVIPSECRESLRSYAYAYVYVIPFAFGPTKIFQEFCHFDLQVKCT
jgi:hypothetical protein